MVPTALPILVAGLAAVAAARNCQNLIIPISISARNTYFTLQAPASNIEVTDFVLNLAQPGVNYASKVLGSSTNGTGGQSANTSGHYTIGATYCEPRAGPGAALQILTHGIAFDRRYWDFAEQNRKYSYADAALARNYSVFFYDRLGLGASSRGDPVNEIQASLEVAALRALTAMLRKGQAPGIQAAYDRVLHVGHSFGSIQAYALAAAHPELSDGIALTGFSLALGGFVTDFLYGANLVEARAASPALAAYPPGYLASADATAVQTNFFAPGNFDPAILEAAYAAGGPVTVGELMTIGSVATGNNSFGGPVLVVTGERDLPFCGGNCFASEPSFPAQVGKSFTNSSSFEAVVVPGAGHGLNLEYSAQTTYASILDFFDENAQS